ncbi:MAG: methyltransferase domain-containing protein [Acidobacteriota bacterium]
MTRALAFLPGPLPESFGPSFARLRWTRAVDPERVALWEPLSDAREAVHGASSWVVVLEPSALPAGGTVPEPPAGSIARSEPSAPASPPFVHTLRELEGARVARAGADAPGRSAISFRTRDFPPAEGETVEAFLARLAASAAAQDDPRFPVIRFEDPSHRERPELTRRLPPGPLRILDVGCGAGAGIAAARARHPAWSVTGIERDPVLAGRARRLCDRVVEGDLAEVLPLLAASGQRFDAIVFADVLEHMEDPVSALRQGLAVAESGGMLLASVPNVGHLSIVRDLVAGRFDPVPAGLCDASHLRWFSRSWLEEALAEAGWRVESVEGEQGAPAPDADAFLALADAWPGADRESLRTYQWIAVCRAA